MDGIAQVRAQAEPHLVPSAQQSGADIAKNELAAQRCGSERDCAGVPNAHGGCLHRPLYANLQWPGPSFPSAPSPERNAFPAKTVSAPSAIARTASSPQKARIIGRRIILGRRSAQCGGVVHGRHCSPDGAKRNPGYNAARHFASLHAGHGSVLKNDCTRLAQTPAACPSHRETSPSPPPHSRLRFR